MKGIGNVSAKYKNIKELLTKNKVLNFFNISSGNVLVGQFMTIYI